MTKRRETYEERTARKIREEEERLRNKPGISKPTPPLRKETYEERTARKIREEEERTRGKTSGITRFFEGENEADESERIERYYPGTTLDLDSRPNPYTSEGAKANKVFDDNGWVSYRDVIDVSLADAHNRNPKYARPGLYATVNDAINEAWDLNLIEYANYYAVGGFWHLYIIS